MLRCSVGRGKNVVERLAVDRVRAGAGLEDHAGDGRLALAGRAVARAGGEVDRRAGDRLLRLLLGSSRLGAAAARPSSARRPRGERVAALGDDVGLEVGAGDRRLDARRAPRLVVARRRPRPRRRRRLGRQPRQRALRLGLSGGLLGLRDGLRGRGAARLLGRGGSAVGSSASAAASGAAAPRPACSAAPRGRCSSSGVLVVGHELSISIGCGFWAACGWSGPA